MGAQHYSVDSGLSILNYNIKEIKSVILERDTTPIQVLWSTLYAAVEEGSTLYLCYRIVGYMHLVNSVFRVNMSKL